MNKLEAVHGAPATLRFPRVLALLLCGALYCSLGFAAELRAGATLESGMAAALPMGWMAESVSGTALMGLVPMIGLR